MSRDLEEVKGQAISKPLLKNIADRRAVSREAAAGGRTKRRWAQIPQALPHRAWALTERNCIGGLNQN